MSDHDQEGIEGLEPQKLFRAALGDAPDDAEAAEQAAEDERRVREEIEARLPDLELFELLGRGGMGHVFRARQTRLDREVALKVVAPEADRQADFAERFAREAQALARLNHPNIVAVYDYGQDGPLGWLVMEYVDGSNLRDLMRAGTLEPSEALALIPRICDALQFAHDQGVVHRDVKPENILLDREGGVKIADFGLAKLIGTSAALVSLTGTQQVLGTLRYMSPEQLDRPLEVDHRADIYSLGVVFYEMLTGEIPMGRFDPPSQCSAASTDVDDVVLRALQREPGRRYQRADDVKSDLESLERGNSPRRAASSPSPAEKESTPTLSLQGACSAALLGVGGVFLIPLLIVLLELYLAPGPDGEAAAPPEFRMSILGIVIIISSLIGLALWSTGSALGFRALDKIRRDWPRLYGAGAAVVGAWAGIFVIADAALLAVILRYWDVPQDIPAEAVVLGSSLLLAGEGAFLVGYRHHFLKRCRAE